MQIVQATAAEKAKAEKALHEYIDALIWENETADEIINRRFGIETDCEYYAIPNAYGGNPTLQADFSFYAPEAKHGWRGQIIVNPSSCSVEMFRNQVKAYYYDVIYSITACALS